jgi:putative ubiquitin-RnfH superfamily antitoxin RatB of RatAB toxin-antitoxin module
MKIEVIAAWPGRTERQLLELPEGASLASVRLHPALIPALQTAWDEAPGLAVYGQRASLSQRLTEGDRIEILRSLKADPKEARRARATAQRAARKAKGQGSSRSV